MYTLDQIRCFIAVADELHFGRAAENLNMTQPPLSRHIMKLENIIGVNLLERGGRSVSLTVAGEEFLGEAKRLISLADRAPLMAQKIAAGETGTLRIGFTASSGYRKLGPLLTEITKVLPNISIDLEELVTSEQTKKLTADELDFGLARPPFDREFIEAKLVATEELSLVVPSGSDLTRLGRGVVGEDLRDVPIIMYSRTKARYFCDLVEKLVQIDTQNRIHVVDQITTMVSLVAAGRGVAFVPKSAEILAFKGVEYVVIDDSSKTPVELYLIWKRNCKNPVVQKFLQSRYMPALSSGSPDT